ncbi:MAG: hypothetical protein WCI77_03375 [Candidatus Omnitrophota bacterium]
MIIKNKNIPDQEIKIIKNETKKELLDELSQYSCVNFYQKASDDPKGPEILSNP